MSITIPTLEPDSITPGDTVKWSRTLADYPASAGWVLSYELVNAAAHIEITATASGDDHLVSIAPASSAAYSPGAYAWRARVSKAGDVYTVATGRITVLPAFGAAVDTRSFARVALANVEAYLQDPANLGAASYAIAGRQLQRHKLDELMALRSRLIAEVMREDNAERAAKGLPGLGRIYVRHTAP